MLKQKSYWPFIASLFLVSLAYAQNIEFDLEQINRNYERQALAMEILYRAYPNHSSKVPAQEELGKIKKRGDEIYYQVGPLENISTSDYSLVVNHDDKMIFLLPKAQIEGEAKFTYVPEEVDKLLATCEKVTFEEVSPDQHVYSLECSLASYSKIKLTYNPKTYFINKMELFYRYALPEEEVNQLVTNSEPARLEIIYKRIDTSPDFADNTFTYENFLNQSKDNKGYQLKQAYKEYQFISQMNQQTTE